jgi:hypothetical protein
MWIVLGLIRCIVMHEKIFRFHITFSLLLRVAHCVSEGLRAMMTMAITLYCTCTRASHPVFMSNMRSRSGNVF